MNLPCYNRNCSGIGLFDDFFTTSNTEKNSTSASRKGYLSRCTLFEREFHKEYNEKIRNICIHDSYLGQKTQGANQGNIKNNNYN